MVRTGMAVCCYALSIAWPLSGYCACTLGAVAVLPVSTQGKHFYSDVQINGKPAHFIIDTGSFTTMLDVHSAQSLGVAANRLNFDAVGIGGTQHLYQGRASRMRIGGMNADGMNLGISQIGMKTDATDASGLFGMNLMAAYDLDLDVAFGHMIMYEADGDCRKPTVALAQPLYMAQLEPIENNRQIAVIVDVEGHPVKAMIDTGASVTVMYRKQASRLGVDLSPLHAPGHSFSHGVGPLPVATMKHVFHTVSIGDLQFNNMPVVIIDQANDEPDRKVTGSRIGGPGDADAANQEQMLLGADFIQKVHVWVSHSSHKLIMQYPPQASVLPH